MDLKKFEDDFKNTEEFKALDAEIGKNNARLSGISIERKKLNAEKKRLNNAIEKLNDELDDAKNRYIKTRLQSASDAEILEIIGGDGVKDSVESETPSSQISAESAKADSQNSVTFDNSNVTISSESEKDEVKNSVSPLLDAMQKRAVENQNVNKN